MELHEKIARLRAAKGMSQSDLAEALGVSRQSVSKWETGASVPDLDRLIGMSDLFGVTLDELVGRTAPPPPPEPERQVVVVERKHLPGRYVVGTVLLILGGLLFLWTAVLGDPLTGLILAVLPVLCGALCLKLEKPGLWCGWAVYDYAHLFCLFATGANPAMVFHSLRYFRLGMIRQLLITWALFACLVGLTVWTAVRYRKAPLPRKWLPAVFWAGIVGCIVVNQLLIRLILAVNTAGTAPVWGVFQILGFLQTMLFAAACVTTAQYVWARRHPGA